MIRRVTHLLIAAPFAAAIVTAACGHDHNGPTSVGGFDTSFLASCGNRTDVFSVSPIASNQVMGWVPLGAMNPSGHTFPTDHQYIYLTSFFASGPPVNLMAPGDVTILGAKTTHYSAGQNDFDYALTFAPCAEVSAEFGHVKTLTAALLSAIGAFDQNCSSYSPTPGQTVTQCYSRNVRVTAKAGDIIGTSAGLDLSLFDSRITPLVFANPSRWVSTASHFDHFHVVPFSDYYAEPMKSAVAPLVGSFDGKVRRTALPIGGTIATDVAGTLQGTWFNPTQPTYPESPHLTIAPDNVDPTKIDFSVGTSGGALGVNLYVVAAPTMSGFVNRHPSQVTPGSQIWCYDFNSFFGMALVQLVDATTIKFEGRPGGHSCANDQPWALTSAAVTFIR